MVLNLQSLEAKNRCVCSKNALELDWHQGKFCAVLPEHKNPGFDVAAMHPTEKTAVDLKNRLYKRKCIRHMRDAKMCIA